MVHSLDISLSFILSGSWTSKALMFRDRDTSPRVHARLRQHRQPGPPSPWYSRKQSRSSPSSRSTCPTKVSWPSLSSMRRSLAGLMGVERCNAIAVRPLYRGATLIVCVSAWSDCARLSLSLSLSPALFSISHPSAIKLSSRAVPHQQGSAASPTQSYLDQAQAMQFASPLCVS